MDTWVGPAGGVAPGGGEDRCHGRVTRVMRGHGAMMGPGGGRMTQVRRGHGVSVSTGGAVLPGSGGQVIVRREAVMTQVMGLVTMMVRGAMVATMGRVAMTMVTSVVTMREVGRALGVMGGRGMLHWLASAAGSVGSSVGGGPAHHHMSHVTCLTTDLCLLLAPNLALLLGLLLWPWSLSLLLSLSMRPEMTQSSHWST